MLPFFVPCNLERECRDGPIIAMTELTSCSKNDMATGQGVGPRFPAVQADKVRLPQARRTVIINFQNY